jgi:hypothetical protein
MERGQAESTHDGQADPDASAWHGGGLNAQQQHPAAVELSFNDRLAMLVDQQWNWRENEALSRRMKAAKLRGNSCVEDIEYRALRGLDKA